jgi:hypothetical protein
VLGCTGREILNHNTFTKTRMGSMREKIEIHSLIYNYLSIPVLNTRYAWFTSKWK